MVINPTKTAISFRITTPKQFHKLKLFGYALLINRMQIMRAAEAQAYATLDRSV